MYQKLKEHQTTAFKGLLSECLACIKVELIFNFLEYCSFTDLFLSSRFLRCFTHSFTVYHSMVYKEWNERRTTAFKGVLTVYFSCIKHVTVVNLVEYCSFSSLFLLSRFLRCFTALFCSISY